MGKTSETKSTSCFLYRRVVVKVGTNVLTAGTDRLDLEVMAGLVGQIARLHQRGLEVILVSSGAIAAGQHGLNLTRKVQGIPRKQVLAAVGQSRLMQAWDQLFSWHSITVAQTLLSRGDVDDRVRYLNARNTLLGLLELRAIPIVNENDVVAIDEIRGAHFGDNDYLSALVANLVDADLLVMLTDTGGLYTADPSRNPQAVLIPYVERIDTTIEAMAGGSRSGRGTGGMATKLNAARLATTSGVAAIIAPGKSHDILVGLIDGARVGTFFAPATTRLEGRKRWMLSGLGRKGEVVVDSGAAAALREQGRSLLSAGVTQVNGSFERGDIVAVLDKDGQPLAYGIANYSAIDLSTIKGQRSEQIAHLLSSGYGPEVIHRNNLVLAE